LQLEASLSDDATGEQLGRHLFWIEWQAVIRLRDDTPRVFNRHVVELVAAAVCNAAYESGVARRERKPGEGT